MLSKQKTDIMYTVYAGSANELRPLWERLEYNGIRFSGSIGGTYSNHVSILRDQGDTDKELYVDMALADIPTGDEAGIQFVENLPYGMPPADIRVAALTQPGSDDPAFLNGVEYAIRNLKVFYG